MGGLDRAYDNIAVLVRAAVALVGSVAFDRAEQRCDAPGFVGRPGMGLVAATPFILARAGIVLVVAPRDLDILATFTFVGFFVVTSLLVGAWWSVAMGADIMRAGAWHSYRSQDVMTLVGIP